MKSPYVVGDRIIVYGSNFSIIAPMYVEAEVIQSSDSWALLAQETKLRFPFLRRKQAWVSWASVGGKVVEHAPDGTPIVGGK